MPVSDNTGGSTPAGKEVMRAPADPPPWPRPGPVAAAAVPRPAREQRRDTRGAARSPRAGCPCPAARSLVTCREQICEHARKLHLVDRRPAPRSLPPNQYGTVILPFTAGAHREPARDRRRRGPPGDLRPGADRLARRPPDGQPPHPGHWQGSWRILVAHRQGGPGLGSGHRRRPEGRRQSSPRRARTEAQQRREHHRAPRRHRGHAELPRGDAAR
jgi:hypothetical protein